ncbi:hypothetical protein [Streptomyces ziwulingensis]|uniref:NAD(+)--protein-arginine ADP-ribosyltransferase n=1 Tax=Streptomyces ziwulingensis TaxID=1045501 RepID=A0ABP9C8T3_9ACTN
MALGLRPRRAGEALDLTGHRAGHALLVHVRGTLDQQALAFARGLPEDPEHHLVVLDLPADLTDATWPEIARVLGRRDGDYRLVTGRRPPDGVLPLGQWLAERLDRTVLVADGAVTPAAGGVLYIPVDSGTGWVRLSPNRPALPVSRRFPKPIWEFSVADRSWHTSARAVADPLPSGVWLRPAGRAEERAGEPAGEHAARRDSGLAGHRGRLEARLACRRDLLTVVLGCPGTPALPLDDVSRFWESVLPGARSQVRFVPYGPLAVPGDTAPGQALADRLDSPVVLCNGMPVGRALWETPQVHTVDEDGTLGWATFARELCYLPARTTGGRPTAPTVLSHRPVVDGIPQIAPGVYRYADDAVLEVVPGGLWMRPSEEPAEAAAIRSAAADPHHFHLVHGTVARAAERMRDLAENLLSRLDPVTRGLARLVPAAQLVRGARALEPAPAARTATGAGLPGRPYPSAPAPGMSASAHGGASAAPAVGAVTAAPAFPTATTRAVPEPPLWAQPVPGIPAAGEPAATADGFGDPQAHAVSSAGGPSAPVTAGGATPTPGPPGQRGPDTGTPRVAEAAPEPAPAQRLHEGFPAAPAAFTAGNPGAHPAPAPTTPSPVGHPAPAPRPDTASPHLQAPVTTPPVTASPGEAGLPDPVIAPDPAHLDPAHPDAPAPAQATPGTTGHPVPAPHPDTFAPDTFAPDAVTPHAVAPDAQAAPAPPMPPRPSFRLVSAPVPGPAGAAPSPPGGHTGTTVHPPGTGTPPGPAAPREAAAAAAATAPETGVPEMRGGPGPGPAGGPRTQPVPAQAACALPPPKGIAREREWLRGAFRQQYNDAAGTVARVLSQSPGLRGTGRTSTEDVVSDLVAAHLYLRGDGALLDRAVRGATVGPHVPLARCVTAGLRRLPSYRGATLMRATLDETEWAWYANRRLVTEWAFGWAMATAAPRLPGDVDFLIWSMTARRTALLDPEPAGRVLFLPGTSFKVLAVRDGERRTVLLRELSASEIGPDGRVDTERTPLDEIALSGLDRADQVWQAAEPESVPKVPDTVAGRFGVPPGLITGPSAAVPDTSGTAGPLPGKRTTS